MLLFGAATQANKLADSELAMRDLMAAVASKQLELDAAAVPWQCPGSVLSQCPGSALAQLNATRQELVECQEAGRAIVFSYRDCWWDRDHGRRRHQKLEQKLSACEAEREAAETWKNMCLARRQNLRLPQRESCYCVIKMSTRAVVFLAFVALCLGFGWRSAGRHALGLRRQLDAVYEMVREREVGQRRLPACVQRCAWSRTSTPGGCMRGWACMVHAW